ncbi:MAG: GspH/FimT family pseudopilin [Longimicrobiales bacterium]|nr:GspH/FimT family pseudopilin [Longimicrobiales bacterium]
MSKSGTGLREDPVFRPSGMEARSRSDRGFTLLELMIVLTVAAVSLVIASQVFRSFLDRSTARQSARVFARDLVLARAHAIQARTSVVVRFSEGDLEYVVENAEGRVLTRRDFGPDEDLALGGLDLQTSGDSVVFNGRGILDMSGIGGSLGTATFSVQGSTYTVSFNATGASRIDES